MDIHFFFFVLIGFTAQLIDGALGMAYGVSSNSFLLTMGLPPATASGSVNQKQTVKQFIAPVAATILLATGSSSIAAKPNPNDPIRLLNVSYDPTRELYVEYNQLFSDNWKKTHGQTVEIEMSHGGSGKQARSVIDGLEADVVTLALAADIDAISEKGALLPADWQTRLASNSAPYYSTVVLLVRAGNPKSIKDWGDLVRSDVKVITPNPKTSGGARWNYLAAWSYASKKFNGDQKQIFDFMKKLFANVPVLDSGARGSSNTFTQTGIGDVLITWENEAFLLVDEVGVGKYEIIMPSISILAEPPVAVVEVNAKRHGTTEIANAYLQFLYTPEAQKVISKHYYRPRDPAVAAAFASKFPKIEMVSIADFGGWKKSQKDHFSDNGVFDRIMKEVAESH